jgi:hypothetical protein
MAKRLTATDKWDKAWFRKLSPRHKALWQFLIDRCDQAGMWEIDLETVSHFINDTTNITEEDFKVFGPRLERYSDEKFWIVDFVSFQCGELSERSPAHKPIFKLLKKYNLLDRVLDTLLHRVQEIEIETEIEKEEEKEKEKDSGCPEFSVSHTGTVVTIEPLSDLWFDKMFDNRTLETYTMTFREKDVGDQYLKFKLKCRNDAESYKHRDVGGMRNAFQKHLEHAPRKQTNNNRGTSRTTTAQVGGTSYKTEF